MDKEKIVETVIETLTPREYCYWDGTLIKADLRQLIEIISNALLPQGDAEGLLTDDRLITDEDKLAMSDIKNRWLHSSGKKTTFEHDCIDEIINTQRVIQDAKTAQICDQQREEAVRAERIEIGNYLHQTWKDRAFMSMLRMDETQIVITPDIIKKLRKGQSFKQEGV